MSWRMLSCAAEMARVVGDAEAEKQYRELARQSRARIFAELWHEDEGLLGSIGADGLWRAHTQTWEQYLAVNAGLLAPDQGRRAMRWLAAHYGFEPRPGVTLLACSDWWPLRWSCQWVPTGDTCLAVLAGMKCGDGDFWYPWLKTAVGSSFRSEFPGINMGISNAGAGGGDREDVDSVDPYLHVTVRGLFGIEPALHEARIDICPAFPAAWTHAGIRTPDIDYEYRRDGQTATFRIRTPRPSVKRVRASLAGPEVVTPSETDSTVTLSVRSLPPYAGKRRPPPILAEQEDAKGLSRGLHVAQPPSAVPGKSAQPRAAVPPSSEGAVDKLAPKELRRLVLFDLSAACNTTPEGFAGTRFIFDAADSPAPMQGWWGSPSLALATSPRMIQSPGGVRFLTVGRPPAESGQTPNNVLAISSWRPHPWPGAATIPVGIPCRRLWLLWQNYVHPMKNYVPNGEIVLRYADGRQTIESLVPPYNLDCYFQHFSRRGQPVPFGHVSGGKFIYQERTFSHADALEIPCDPAKLLKSVSVRGTCTEGALGVLGLTVEKAD